MGHPTLHYLSVGAGIFFGLSAARIFQRTTWIGTTVVAAFALVAWPLLMLIAVGVYFEKRAGL